MFFLTARSHSGYVRDRKQFLSAVDTALVGLAKEVLCTLDVPVRGNSCIWVEAERFVPGIWLQSVDHAPASSAKSRTYAS